MKDKKISKRLLVAALAGTMLFSAVMAGCGGDNKTDTGSKTTASSTAESKASEESKDTAESNTSDESSTITEVSTSENTTTTITIKKSSNEDNDTRNNKSKEPEYTIGKTVSSGICGDNVNWILDDKGLLVISGSGEMNDYDHNDNMPPWDNKKNDIKTIIVHNEIYSIGSCAFYEYPNLSGITIPNTIRINDNAFNGCTGLTTVTMSDNSFYGGQLNIGEGAFKRCTGLKSITLPKTMHFIDKYSFYGCTGLTSITIPDSVTNIYNEAFRKCTNLTNITISDNLEHIESDVFDDTGWYESQQDGILYLGNIAYGYKGDKNSVKELVLKNGIKIIAGSAFDDCSNLTSVTIPNGVTTIEQNAFCECRSLTNITIPDSVTNIGRNAFYGCTELTSITIPDSVNEIGYYAFVGCTNLTIHGKSGSRIEYYAKENNIPFVAE